MVRLFLWANFFCMMTGHELWNVLILVRIGMYVVGRDPEGFRIIVLPGDLFNVWISTEQTKAAVPHLEIWYRVGVV